MAVQPQRSSPGDAKPSWYDRAEDKRKRILSQIPPQFDHPELTHSLEDTGSVLHVPGQLLSQTELSITEQTAVAIVRRIRDRVYTSVEVLNAFVHRAVIAHRLLNCCLDFPYT